MKTPVPYFLLLLFFLDCNFIKLVAQPLFLFNDSREHVELLNPAAVFNGYDKYHNLYFGLSYLEQGFNISNLPLKPKNLRASGTYIFDKLKTVNFKPIIGGSITSRQIGPTFFNDLNLRIGLLNLMNRRANPSLDKGLFSSALSFKVNQFTIKASETHGLEPDDPLLQSNHSVMIPNIGLGFYYRSRIFRKKMRFYLGASIPQFFAMDLSRSSISDSDLFVKVGPRLCGIFGFQLYDRSLTRNKMNNFLEVTAYSVSSSEQQFFLDLNVRYYLASYNFWMATGFSTWQIVHSQIGFDLYKGLSKEKRNIYQAKQPILRISLGYHFQVGRIQVPLQNSLEINISRLLSTL